MISRSTLFSSLGGDTVQVVETAKELRKLGLTVDVKLTHEQINYNEYDLLHFFNIGRPADILRHVKKSNVPYVLSTIFVDYAEFDRGHRDGMSGLVLKPFSSHGIEYIKTLSRWLRGSDRRPIATYLMTGQRKSMERVLQNAALLLPNSNSEFKRLSESFDLRAKYHVVPNGVDLDVFKHDPSIQKDPDLVLCVARIEGIKNQINLIRAMNGTRMKLVLVGAAASNQRSYYNACTKMGAANVSFTGALSQNQLRELYAKAKVHVLPSWFETTGLSSLEAAAMGCNIVITAKGDAKEYFKDDAWYCDPSAIDSIRSAVEDARSAAVNDRLRNKILTFYTWKNAAVETLKAYQSIKP